MNPIATDFSAKEPSLGYFYQIKYALYLLLAKSDEFDNPKIQIESLDDIEIGEINNLHLYQTKYHVKAKANLTDAGVDFWKTIRVWSEHLLNNIIDIDKTLFSLVTTEKISETSVLYNFKSQFMNDLELGITVDKLISIASLSENNTNQKAYKAFLSLPLPIKKKLISKIKIYDASIDIDEINRKIRKLIGMFVYPAQIDAFVEILEGWWLRKAIDNLSNKNQGIDLDELQNKIASIRDSFSIDNLPNHFPEQLNISDEDVELEKEKVFIRQLEVIELDVNSNMVKRAISDFRRAFEQRSKWLRLHLLNPDEQEEYDKKLIDYWENIFEILKDETLGKDAAGLKKYGKDFYVQQFAKTCPQIKIRERFNEDFLTRGSYQILSDSKKIGWHPDYKNIL